MLTRAKLVKVTFHYRHNKEPDVLNMTQREFADIAKRIFEKKGIIRIDDNRYDLTMINKIEIEFYSDFVVI